MDFGQAVFRRQHKGLRQIIAGNDHALFFRLVQKCHRLFGIGGVVQIKNADNGRISNRHIIANRQIHTIPPLHRSNPLPTWKDFLQYNSKSSNIPHHPESHDRETNAAIPFHQKVVLPHFLPF